MGPLAAFELQSNMARVGSFDGEIPKPGAEKAKIAAITRALNCLQVRVDREVYL